jgi:hypothetical protein
MRKRLGGRASTEPGAGEIVGFTTDGGLVFSGVVLFVRGDDLDVWVSEAVVRRTRRANTKPLETSPAAEMIALAKDTRVFASLHEGARIRYLEAGALEEGQLVEKCRFGALVERPDGKIFGVGFRKIWPAKEPGEAS